MSGIKDVLLRAAMLPPVTGALAPFTRDHACIFMLHRFAHPDRGVLGHDPALVRASLAWLRREGFTLIGVRELLQRLQDGGPALRRAVGFTIDDGYADHAEIAAPLFAEFDCPVTTFVATGFLDRQLWFWWDRIEFAFEHSTRMAATVGLSDAMLDYAWPDGPGRKRAQVDFIERCKRVPDAEKHAGIERLAGALGVELPAAPPSRYAPMTWDQLREVERRGMSFGPHTVTHPVLSQTPDAQSHAELHDSWARLRSQAHAPVPIFCYPNGGWQDFGDREVRTLREIGIAGAVVGETGFADRATLRKEQGAFRVRRFAFPDRLALAAQYASGLERLKLMLRGGS